MSVEVKTTVTIVDDDDNTRLTVRPDTDSDGDFWIDRPPTGLYVSADDILEFARALIDLVPEAGE